MSNQDTLFFHDVCQPEWWKSNRKTVIAKWLSAEDSVWLVLDHPTRRRLMWGAKGGDFTN